ncbi:hypothetical protein [Nocardioides salarius]|uniref:hypothetical protein n=1 Tax=Nocardioides salarius TaxID=374513 RepID=UPI0030F612C1
MTGADSEDTASSLTLAEAEAAVREAGAPRSAEDAAYEWGRYQAWAEVNGISVLPSQKEAAVVENTLLLYLHHHFTERGWSMVTVRNVGGHLARCYMAVGYPDPRGRCWDRYLKACAALRPPGPKMDVFSEEQMAALAALERCAVAEPGNPFRLVAAASLALGDLLEWTGSPTTFLRHALDVEANDFLTRAQDIVISHAGRRVVVDPVRHPVHHRVLAQLLDSRDQDGQQVEQPSVSALLTAWEQQHAGDRSGTRARSPRTRSGARFRKHLITVYRWLSGCTDARDAVLADDVAGWWHDADGAERSAAIRLLELGEAGVQHAADSAWFFTAVCAGWRAAEMSRLDFSHWDAARRSATTEGYEFVLAPQSHKSGRIALAAGQSGDPLRLFVWHTGPGATAVDGTRSHPQSCPACMLERHVELRQQIDDVDPDDPLFVTLEGNRVSTAQAARIVERIWERVAHLDAHAVSRRIGSRSVRITTATMAWARGLSLADLADLLGHGRGSYSVTLGYVAAHVREANEALVHPAVRDPVRDGSAEDVGGGLWRLTPHAPSSGPASSRARSSLR